MKTPVFHPEPLRAPWWRMPLICVCVGVTILFILLLAQVLAAELEGTRFVTLG